MKSPRHLVQGAEGQSNDGHGVPEQAPDTINYRETPSISLASLFAVLNEAARRPQAKVSVEALQPGWRCREHHSPARHRRRDPLSQAAPGRSPGSPALPPAKKNPGFTGRCSLGPNLWQNNNFHPQRTKHEP
jgi:hypothetical protein